jgi:CheY-like chemotaxis protein
MLSIAKVQGQLSLTVRDHGKGFDVMSAQNQGNTHFGLFSIRERMEGIGGHFEIVSSAQQGTIARLLLPLESTPIANESASPGGASSITRIESPDRPWVRILMVDDHPLVRQGMRGVVEGVDNMQVIGEASNGKEAVALSLSLRPNVVIMDVNMPVMNGVEATRLIKAQCPGITVVGLSVNNDRQVQAAMKAAGASAYLTKDVAPELLCNVISEALGLKTKGDRPLEPVA